MLLDNELLNINGGCFQIYKMLRYVKVHLKYIIVRYFI